VVYGIGRQEAVDIPDRTPNPTHRPSRTAHLPFHHRRGHLAEVIDGFLKVVGLLALIVVGLPALGYGIVDAIGWHGYRTFTSRLEVGMTRQKVDALITATGGSHSGELPDASDDDFAEELSGTHVWYYYDMMPCFNGGTVFTLYFKANRLHHWHSADSANAC